eukprot:CAMPEP_0181210302 /NCGR_PEP_ID=MMETSP1096-20121128/23152_1 /TAXON_ID=156174 ORGANISM="Chrysochromulina ericina, Strain CCMP281" /NCGR_SAMPLE_ID=MMETSP1096 /ASSEMBLY_ACC=CAM_ASM_000453 /LENGTH=35 /DNA_ID= /DNA_START= /DNA_END= /DNA_ORIENTATION=
MQGAWRGSSATPQALVSRGRWKPDAAVDGIDCHAV